MSPVCQHDAHTAAVNSHVDTTASGAPESDPSTGTKRFHDRVWYYFDSVECRMQFVSNPDALIGR